MLLTCTQEGCQNQYPRGRGRHANPLCPDHRVPKPNSAEPQEKPGLKPWRGPSIGECSACLVPGLQVENYYGYLCAECLNACQIEQAQMKPGQCDRCFAQGEVQFIAVWWCSGCTKRLIAPSGF